MSKQELIVKWTDEKDMWRSVVDNPLMWTIEDRKKASSRVTVLCAILEDIKTLPE